MKILQSIETGGPGGAEGVLISLCAGLRVRGHEVEVVLLKRGWLADQLGDAGVETHILSLSGGIDRPFVAALARMLRDRRADVLHTHEFSMTFYGRRAAVAAGVAHAGTIHGKNFVSDLRRRVAAGITLRARPGTALTTVSRELASHVGRRAIPRLRGIEVVQNGIPLPADVTVQPRDRGPLRLIAVGNLYPVKNHGLMIEAVAALARRGIDARLTILGRGAEQPVLEEAARRHGVADRVELAGFREDVPAFLAAADVFVSSSLSEGMPLSFLEAMGHGLPIVASRVGGVPEIVEDGRQGLLFACGDVDAASAALERLAGDDRLRRKLAEAALHDARETWSAEAMVSRYLEVYERIARRD